MALSESDDLTSRYLTARRGQTGFKNMGNTCFMNAALVCLMQTEPLVRFFLTQRFRADLNPEKSEHKFTLQLYRIVEGFWSENCSIIPKNFKLVLEEYRERYKGWFQHDSHETLILILELLHESLSYEVKISAAGSVDGPVDLMQIESIKCWNTIFKNQYSTIVEQFYGQYHNEMVCNLCGGAVHNYDPFCAVEVPVSGIDNLDTAMQRFTHPEVLDDGNRWKCEHCNGEANARKTITFWRLPEVLIIQLKRFSYDGRLGRKDDRMIEFPAFGLDLTPYLSEHLRRKTKNKCVFDLYAITNHIGGVAGGHYFSYCRNLVSGQWYEHNDSSVSLIKSTASIFTPSAYVLFYRAR